MDAGRTQGAGPGDRGAGRGHGGPGGPGLSRARTGRRRRKSSRCAHVRSIWPAIYPELLELVQEHTSTIIFVNNRRAAERLAKRLNELANGEGEQELPATEHAGRTAGADRGRPRGAPSGAPPDGPGRLRRDRPGPPRLALPRGAHAGRGDAQVRAAALPRRDLLPGAGHRHGRRRPGDPGRVAEVGHPRPAADRPRRPLAGRGLAKAGSSPSSAPTCSSARSSPGACAKGEIEETVIPQNPLDVLAQHLVSMAALDEWEVDEVERLVTATEPFHELSREQLENVLDMLDGRYPSDRFAELRPRIVWDRTERHHPRPQRRPPAGRHQRRHDPRPRPLRRPPARRPPGRRARRGDGLRGPPRPDLPARRHHLADRGNHPRPGDRHPGPRRPRRRPLLEGRRDRPPGRAGPGDRRLRPRGGLARAGRAGRRVRPRPRAPPRTSSPTCASSRQATRVVPSDETIVVERFRDEIGDWRLCILSPYGGRVHAAWGLALAAKIRAERDLEADAIWSDDGIVIHLPDADEPPPADLVLIEPDELEDLIVGELSGSALFGARFRENAARSLLIPRAYPGKRTPLWQQRLKSQSLLEVARDFPRFPVILETYRECLQRRPRPALAGRAAARAARRASSAWSRSRPRPPRPSPPRCSSTTSPPTCTRGTRRTPSGGRRRWPSTATCCASCSARRSCAS